MGPVVTGTVLDREPPPADERIPYGDAELEFADLRLPTGDGPHPCAIAIHGGFWRNPYDLEHFGHLCAALTSLGLATWNIEYRRVGDPGGGWPGTFEDVTAASNYLFDHAAELRIDPEHVIVLGHSAGGQLASWLASMANVPGNSPIRSEPLPLHAAVPLAGVLHLRQGWLDNLGNGAVAEFLGGSPDLVGDRYAAASPMVLLPSPTPHLVVHGIDDDIVPVTMSGAYHSQATRMGARASLLTLPGADHFDIIDPESTAWPEIASAIISLINS